MSLDPRTPSSYPRRILLAVTGLSPQVVTETLYALAVKPRKVEERFIPTEVRLVTTATGAREARHNLLAKQTGWFHRLCTDYRLPSIEFTEAHIEVLRDANGELLDDIRTLEENERAADFITQIVRDLTGDPDTALHVSIAGGRKTMGYYLGYALSLYGRAQDCLSHVLVSEPFESNREFFYPTPYFHCIHAKRGDKESTHDAHEAKVELAQIPFVRLRDDLPERLRRGQARFSHVVTAANRALGEPCLVLNPAAFEALADDEKLDLGQTEFTVLWWLAERARHGDPQVDWSTKEAAGEFLDIARRALNPMGGEYERIEKALKWRKEAAIKLAKYFEPHKSRINKVIKDTLGPAAAARYHIQCPRGTNVNFLPLEPGQIEIRN